MEDRQQLILNAIFLVIIIVMQGTQIMSEIPIFTKLI
jgi:hypothetical protein